jgi:hypothetical protein
MQLSHELLFNPKVRQSRNTIQQWVTLGHPGHFQSKEKIEHYWALIGAEISQIGSSSPMPMLAGLINELKSMLLYLYPGAPALKEHHVADLDGDHLIREIQTGRIDCNAFTTSIVEILHANCAPKRDVMIDHLTTLGKTGNWLKVLPYVLELIELMKLVLGTVPTVNLYLTFTFVGHD